MSKRTAARELQSQLFGESTLPTICLDIRGSINGSCDPWIGEDICLARAFLTVIVEEWEPSWHPCDEDMDNAILALIRATIAYIDLNPESME